MKMAFFEPLPNRKHLKQRILKPWLKGSGGSLYTILIRDMCVYLIDTTAQPNADFLWSYERIAVAVTVWPSRIKSAYTDGFTTLYIPLAAYSVKRNFVFGKNENFEKLNLYLKKTFFTK